jgi:hypothetical protein
LLQLITEPPHGGDVPCGFRAQTLAKPKQLIMQVLEPHTRHQTGRVAQFFKEHDLSGTPGQVNEDLLLMRREMDHRVSQGDGPSVEVNLQGSCPYLRMAQRQHWRNAPARQGVSVSVRTRSEGVARTFSEG